MRLLPLLFPARPARPTRRPRRPPPIVDERSLPDEDTPPRGCAWFDSSRDLVQGLEISVHDGRQELAQLVPVRWWLQWELDAAMPPVRR